MLFGGFCLPLTGSRRIIFKAVDCDYPDLRRQVKRLFFVQYGVEIVYRRDGSLPGGGEYSIEGWGVFDPAKINRFLSQ